MNYIFLSLWVLLFFFISAFEFLSVSVLNVCIHNIMRICTCVLLFLRLYTPGLSLCICVGISVLLSFYVCISLLLCVCISQCGCLCLCMYISVLVCACVYLCCCLRLRISCSLSHFLCFSADGDGLQAPRWALGCRGAARAEPAGDEGGGALPVDTRVSGGRHLPGRRLEFKIL